MTIPNARMVEFLIALAVFLGAHVVPTRPPVRRRLVAGVGERAYLAGYSLLSLALLAWVIDAAIRAPYVGLWTPQPWQHAVAVWAMPFALMLLGAGLAAPNPLSVSLVRARGGPPAGVLAITRHPILWGFALWALAHILSNGDLVSVILFGGFAAFAILGTVVLDRRRRRELGQDAWAEAAAPTSNLPLVALARDRARWRSDGATLAGLAAGLAAYGLFIAGVHTWLFGVDPTAVFLSSF